MFRDQIPSLQAFLEQATAYDVVCLKVKTLSDYDTPTSIFKKLQADYLLESVDKGESVGRYSIIGSGERVRITLAGRTITFSEERIALAEPPHREVLYHYTNPLDFVRDYFLSLTMASELTPHGEETRPFLGGLMGYLGYETVNYFEAIPIGKDVLEVPDGLLVFPRLIAVYDTVLRELIVATTVLTRRRKAHHKWNQARLSDNFEKLPQALLPQVYESAKTLLINAMQTLEKLPTSSLYSLSNGITPATSSHTKRREATESHDYFDKDGAGFTPNMDAKRYEQNVLALIEHIRSGEMIQAVLSKRYSLTVKTDGFELYRSLKALNPSPFLYYLNFGDFEIIGSSPEVMVRLQGDDLLLRPIAGSIRRGRDHAEDEILAQELLSDEKERAEHLMLVDLGRNDLARVARAGSVKVENYMTVEKYSQIQHIVSTVTAKKKPECDVLDVIAATFPAGTLSGAPKVRAMELIATFEHDKRGPYGGMLFNLGLGGNLDSCICIRSFVVFKDALHVQVGSGIVLDSVPAKEHRECEQKVAALMKAYTLTRERFLHAMTSSSS